MNILITGGMGFVGQATARRLTAAGHHVTILGRNLARKGPAPAGVTLLEADATRPGPWQEALARQDCVVNLAGVSIFSRWTAGKKREIATSRIAITRNVVDGLRAGGSRSHLISASAVGYYGFRGDEELDEEARPGDDFLAQVCRDWEEQALAARASGIGVTLCRLGVVLGPGGGALDLLTTIFRLRLGSRLGSGRQYFSWIHLDDLTAIIEYLAANPAIEGPVNCTAPAPVTNRELTRALNRALDVRSLAPPAPAFALRLLLGEFGSFLLTGQRAVPRRLSALGFSFTHPRLEEALEELIGRRKGSGA